jgi:hypothetical protein
MPDDVTAAVERAMERDRPDLQKLVQRYGRWDLIPAEAHEQFQLEVQEWQARIRSGYYWLAS